MEKKLTQDRETTIKRRLAVWLPDLVVHEGSIVIWGEFNLRWDGISTYWLYQGNMCVYELPDDTIDKAVKWFRYVTQNNVRNYHLVLTQDVIVPITEGGFSNINDFNKGTTL